VPEPASSRNPRNPAEPATTPKQPVTAINPALTHKPPAVAATATLTASASSPATHTRRTPSVSTRRPIQVPNTTPGNSSTTKSTATSTGECRPAATNTNPIDATWSPQPLISVPAANSAALAQPTDGASSSRSATIPTFSQPERHRRQPAGHRLYGNPVATRPWLATQSQRRSTNDQEHEQPTEAHRVGVLSAGPPLPATAPGGR